jgi:hypothetical protein
MTNTTHTLSGEQLRNALRECSEGTIDAMRNNWPFAQEFARAIEAHVLASHGKQERPIGYVSASELSRLSSGRDAQLRSSKFGPSILDGDIPVFASQVSAQEVRDAALAEAQNACMHAVASKGAVNVIGVAAHYAACGHAIEALKSAPITEQVRQNYCADCGKQNGPEGHIHTCMPPD